MANDKADVLFIGPHRDHLFTELNMEFVIHHAPWPEDVDDALTTKLAPTLRYVAVGGHPGAISGATMAKLPKLEIVSNFGVGYDNVDTKYAAAHDIMVTNTPDVLNEEVADTTLGLLLATTRDFIQADRYVVQRLRGLMVKKRGRNLHAGQAEAWTEDWFNGHGRYRLRGTVRYPRAA